MQQCCIQGLMVQEQGQGLEVQGQGQCTCKLVIKYNLQGLPSRTTALGYLLTYFSK